MRGALALAFLATTLAAHGAEVTVLSAGAVKSAFTAASDAWSKQQGSAVRATFAPAGELRKRVASGEVTDLLIVPADNFADYEKAVVPGTRRDLGKVAI